MRREHDGIRRGSYGSYEQQFPEVSVGNETNASYGAPYADDDDESYCSPFLERLADVCGFLALAIALGTVAYLGLVR